MMMMVIIMTRDNNHDYRDDNEGDAVLIMVTKAIMMVSV